MSRPLLTITLPTRDRAAVIDRQLICLRGAIHNLPGQCELLVSDDASRDNTWEMLEQWRQVMAPHLRTRRNARPLGELGNVAACFQEAQGRFVWLVADDGISDEATPSRLAQVIENNPHLAAISLNHGCTVRNDTGKRSRWDGDQTIAGPEFAMAAIREWYQHLAFTSPGVPNGAGTGGGGRLAHRHQEPRLPALHHRLRGPERTGSDPVRIDVRRCGRPRRS